MSIGSFGGRWWIRTTEVIDDRFTVCSLWPLGKPSIFNYQLDWSWWTDLNPRPADYKSAALPTELHQRFIKSSCLSDLFSIPHTGVFVNRFIRNYCILFFRVICKSKFLLGMEFNLTNASVIYLWNLVLQIAFTSGIVSKIPYKQTRRNR